MITKRIIPCLDVKDGRVVKGVNFLGLADVSSPIKLAEYYSKCGADELVFYDITASYEGRALFTDILREVASKIFIPLTVGGGINTIEDFDRVLKCGADKVSVNSGAIRNPELIRVLDKSPFELSGGQKRRAAIAGIIAMRPDVLVLDEPAAGLDPRGRASIFKNISDYREKTGKTVVIVSHSMEDVARYCDELIVMSGAKLLMSGTPDKVFSQPELLVRHGLDLPQIARLNMLLREKGVDLGDGVYTVDGAFERIIKKKQD